MVGIFVWCGVGNRKGICGVEKGSVIQFGRGAQIEQL